MVYHLLNNGLFGPEILCFYGNIILIYSLRDQRLDICVESVDRRDYNELLDKRALAFFKDSTSGR